LAKIHINEIKTIFEKNNIDVITDGSNLEEISSFRRKVVKLVCSQIMAKMYNLLPHQSYFSGFQFLEFSGALVIHRMMLNYPMQNQSLKYFLF
jgi:ribosomal protein S8